MTSFNRNASKPQRIEASPKSKTSHTLLPQVEKTRTDQTYLAGVLAALGNVAGAQHASADCPGAVQTRALSVGHDRHRYRAQSTAQLAAGLLHAPARHCGLAPGRVRVLPGCQLDRPDIVLEAQRLLKLRRNRTM